MDVFAIEKGKALKLSVDEFEKQTCHEYPYYRTKKDKRLSLYAICPECGNPIQIVNMYGEEMMQNVTRKVTLYGKHTGRAVEGFPYWNEAEMKNCSLYKPSPLGNTEIRTKTEESEEIKEIIEKNWRKIKQNIRGIVGVNLTNKEMDHMYEVFMDSRAYSYKAVNKYNIPYAMIRYQEAISIYRTFLFDSPMSEIVKDRINCNSKYFEIPDKEIVKKGSGFYNIGIYFTKYQRKEHKQYIHMVILNQLIKCISEQYAEKQILISTHSSFVANKLGLGKVMLLDNLRITRFSELPEDTYNFFKKVAGYDTLRMILCKKTILCEGDSDELVIQKAYMQLNDGRLPIEDGIEVISVGVSFLRFLEIADCIQTKIAVVTDNDGDMAAINKKYANYIGAKRKEYIKICVDDVVDTGTLKIGKSDYNYNTLEPKLLKVNGLDKLNQIFGTDYTNEDDLRKFMKHNKTECALRIFESSEQIEIPEYILEAIRW